MACCPRLREVYLRRNALAEIGEVAHLRGLSALRVLWLADNPMAEGGVREREQYRATVIRTLPQLQKLDNKREHRQPGDGPCAARASPLPALAARRQLPPSPHAPLTACPPHGVPPAASDHPGRARGCTGCRRRTARAGASTP